MEKRIVTLLMLMFCAIGAMAQQLSVQCQVNDSKGEGVPFATIYIYNIGDTTRVVSSGVSDAFGKVDHHLANPGSYLMRVHFVGMASQESTFEVSASSPVAQLGTIVLNTESTMLSEVTVTAQRQLVTAEIDRLTYDVQADADSKTSNVLDMLRKVPMVSVDGKDDVLVKGTSSFKVYRNGHPDPALSGQNMKDVLKAIPASTIKKIEVITDPGAKYDAEGTESILNIVTVGGSGSLMQGVMGTVSLGVDNTGSPNANASVVTQIGKVVASVNYGYNNKNRHYDHNIMESEHSYATTGNSLYSHNETRGSFNFHYGNLSASWEPDSLNLVSLSFGGYYYGRHSDGFNNARMTDRDGNVLYHYTTTGRVPKSGSYDLHGRVDYQHLLHNPGEMLTLSYMLSTSHNNLKSISSFSDMLNCPFPYTGQTTDTKETFAEHTFQFDWTRPFAKYHTIETGVKYINRFNTSEGTFGFDGAPEMDNTTLFNHRTHVAAAYLSYRFSKDNWSARAGMRYEYSRLNAEFPDGSHNNYHRNLNDWVPDLSVRYKFNDAHSLKINYSTSIRRPGISYLNPAVVEDPTSRKFGNPHLGSSLNHSISMTYMKIGGKLTFNLSPGISFSNNRITGIQYTDGDVLVSTYANTLKSRYLSLSGFLQWAIGPTTSFTLNGNVGHYNYESRDLNLKNSRWVAFYYAQLTQQLPWKLRFAATLSGRSGGVDGLYGHYTGTMYYNFSLQRSFLKDDRLTVNLSTANLFNSSKYNKITMYTTHGDYTGWDRAWQFMREFRLTVTYRFGSLKAGVKKTNKTIENNDLVGGSGRGGN
ncbi:MAG: outer membrane beta-barrel family protein [Bacteroidales bacterium]|nr:outer membrane beta-barrel family protein [Bacteroidales bacterium]